MDPLEEEIPALPGGKDHQPGLGAASEVRRTTTYVRGKRGKIPGNENRARVSVELTGPLTDIQDPVLDPHVARSGIDLTWLDIDLDILAASRRRGVRCGNGEPVNGSPGSRDAKRRRQDADYTFGQCDAPFVFRRHALPCLHTRAGGEEVDVQRAVISAVQKKVTAATVNWTTAGPTKGIKSPTAVRNAGPARGEPRRVRRAVRSVREMGSPTG